MDSTFDDPFAVLGVPRSWSMDIAALHTLQARLLAMHHPDRSADPAQIDDAVANSARVNAAVAVLASPLLRAEALIALGDPAGAAVALPQASLVQLLELRDALSQAGSAAEVGECRRWVAGERAAREAALGSTLDAPVVDWPAARLHVAHLRALARLDEDAQRREGQCGGVAR